MDAVAGEVPASREKLVGVVILALYLGLSSCSALPSTESSTTRFQPTEPAEAPTTTTVAPPRTTLPRPPPTQPVSENRIAEAARPTSTVNVTQVAQETTPPAPTDSTTTAAPPRTTLPRPPPTQPVSEDRIAEAARPTSTVDVTQVAQETTPSAPTDSTTTAGTQADLEQPRSASVSLSELTVVDVHDHDPDAFTQGLAFRNGHFYESTGLYGRSSVRIVDPVSGEVLRSIALDNDYFGEGLEVVGDRIVQLTWKAGVAFIWDTQTLEPLGTYTYEGEGWGLCAFTDHFVMSDGSSTLAFRDLDTFEVVGEVEVILEDQPVHHLNELECVGDVVYANIWLSDEIMVISPITGQVVTRIDGSALRQHLTSTEGIDVLNGIAYDPNRQVLYLTGKLWPEIFEVLLPTEP